MKQKQNRKMSSEHEREIIQLWWVASHYLDLADTVMNRDKEMLEKDKVLQMTVKDLADKCRSISDIIGGVASLIQINAHLGSCAVRLNTIDERLKSRRWDFYEELKAKRDKLQTSEIRVNLSLIMHCLLRHNVAHMEDPPGNTAYKIMRDVFNNLKIEELIDNLRCVKQSIKEDIERHRIRTGS